MSVVSSNEVLTNAGVGDGIRTVELSAQGSWVEFIRETISETQPVYYSGTLGIESNVFVEEQGAMIVETRIEHLGAIIVDYDHFCERNEVEREAIALSW